MNEWCVVSSSYLDGPEMRVTYSWDDDPKEALLEARQMARGARFRMLWYKYGTRG